MSIGTRALARSGIGIAINMTGDFNALDQLARSGLESHFDGIHVVREKVTAVFQQLIAQYGLESERTWMVGNSPRSDINPALEAGISAVHIPHSNTWSFEQQEIVDPDQVVVLRSFGELRTLFSEIGEDYHG